MILSTHFIENWQSRVGSWPTPKTVQAVIRSSVRVQNYKNFICHDGEIITILSIYWSPEMDIIITVDKSRDVAVSVLTPEVLKKPKQRPKQKHKQKYYDGRFYNVPKY